MKSEENIDKLWSSHSFSNFKLYKNSDFLPFRPEPLPNELLTSWLCRLARANYSCYSGFIRSITANNNLLKGRDVRYHSWDLDRKCPKILLDLLSRLTGFSINNIQNLALNDFEDKIPDTLFAGIKTKTMGGLRFCPLCLKNDEIPYYRNLWRLCNYQGNG